LFIPHDIQNKHYKYPQQLPSHLHILPNPLHLIKNHSPKTASQNNTGEVQKRKLTKLQSPLQTVA